MLDINKDMLPMKGHYFLFNAGTAPLVPFLSTYAKQLGFSSSIVGVIYTFLPVFGMLAKPLFGAIGDRFHKHKFLFILFQAVTIAGFAGIYFIPQEMSSTAVLSCGNGESFFHTCRGNSTPPNACTPGEDSGRDAFTNCRMNCSVDSAYMWQSICEHWRIPTYCYDLRNTFDFTSTIEKSKYRIEKNCVVLPLNKTTMEDGLSFNPRCQYVPYQSFDCKVFCAHKGIEVLGLDNGTNVVCDKNGSYILSCGHSASDQEAFQNSFGKESGFINCTTMCQLKSLKQWAELCDGWKADLSRQCKGNIVNQTHISFLGQINLNMSEELESCSYFKLQKIFHGNDKPLYPTCPRYNSSVPLFRSKCSVDCDDSKINELISNNNKGESSTSHSQFWPFFVSMSLNWIGMAVVVSIGDAICFEKLGDKGNDYGRQRLWGSLGWGIFSLLTGFLIDKFSPPGENKNYTIAFVLMLIFLVGDIVVSFSLQYRQKKLSVNLFKNIGFLFSSLQTVHFFMWIVFVGMCTGLQWQFLFWYLEDLASQTDCEQVQWIKTLQGLVGGLQCFGGELPFFFLSGIILKKIGHVNSMTLVLLGFGLRFVLYSILENPWWTLPIELFQGLTFGMLYATMASYASMISPPGIEATVMGLVGAVFEGIGTSLGSLISGMLYGSIGGALTFRLFGCISLICCLANVVLVVLKPFKKPAAEGTAATENMLT